MGQYTEGGIESKKDGDTETETHSEGHTHTVRTHWIRLGLVFKCTEPQGNNGV